MIIDDLDVKGVTGTPPETDPPLPVDADDVLALSIALQRLELGGRMLRSNHKISCRITLSAI
jgi:hypothetical protein